MEPVYSEWKPVIDAHNRQKRIYCRYCSKDFAKLMKRYHTNRDGERETQYRVECPMCKSEGKVFLHESIAELSWDAGEKPTIPAVSRETGLK